ncbi:hypothetical protein [Archaeoglobus neptunius]|uniref:hypothetical protein n=1 Tax=Archaeoglobus neptunius TaxID=2798580 RepID=UPI0019294B81|nr:hypothetical protein [Archaeoglobus neptunius]
MPVDVWMAASYLLQFIQKMFMLNGEIAKIIAENSTLVTRATEDIYYLFGFLKYFSDCIRDATDVVMNNTTMIKYSVGMWQKVAGNITYIAGDENASRGLAYILRKEYECIQPGGYCESYGSSITYWGLESLKWVIILLSKIGAKLSAVYR